MGSEDEPHPGVWGRGGALLLLLLLSCLLSRLWHASRHPYALHCNTEASASYGGGYGVLARSGPLLVCTAANGQGSAFSAEQQDALKANELYQDTCTLLGTYL